MPYFNNKIPFFHYFCTAEFLLGLLFIFFWMSITKLKMFFFFFFLSNLRNKSQKIYFQRFCGDNNHYVVGALMWSDIEDNRKKNIKRKKYKKKVFNISTFQQTGSWVLDQCPQTNNSYYIQWNYFFKAREKKANERL